MNTLTLRDPIPDTLGAFDRLVSLARQQRIENDAHEATKAQRTEWAAADLEKILSAGNLRAPVFFAKRSNPVKAPSVQEVLWEVFEENADLQGRLMQLLFFASEGCDVSDYAKELRRLAVLKAAEWQAEESL